MSLSNWFGLDDVVCCFNANTYFKKKLIGSYCNNIKVLGVLIYLILL